MSKIPLILSTTLFIFGIGFITGTFITRDKLKTYGEEQFLKGYNQYLFDYYVPAPFIKDKKEIPIKRRNPKLKEKFKG